MGPVRGRLINPIPLAISEVRSSTLPDKASLQLVVLIAGAPPLRITNQPRLKMPSPNSYNVAVKLREYPIS